jgi:hypothetical protein
MRISWRSQYPFGSKKDSKISLALKRDEQLRLDVAQISKGLFHDADERLSNRFANDHAASTGSKRIESREPVAFAYRCKVRVDGIDVPLSSRATTDCEVLIRLATSVCVRPARLRASIIALASPNSSVHAGLALRNSKSRADFLCGFNSGIVDTQLCDQHFTRLVADS